ncbi:acyl transferase [Aquimarina hainanensis]|uniref:Acyl transferase n=1 Tax=Aquimarina hainanensis TaxID=1578017 RepID=A0ABW5N2S0_9FLAO
MLSKSIFSIKNSQDFETVALNVFQHQYTNNKIYQRFCNLLGVTKTSVRQITDIPFMPIEFFKQYPVIDNTPSIAKIFTSSGTTGTITSKHYVADLALYEQSFRKAFSYFYGDITDYTVLALLPSYLEREGSSLVYMTEQLIKDSKTSSSGFYLHDTDKLIKTLQQCEGSSKKTLLIGVSFALLDLVEAYPLSFKNIIIMETGGMKGRRKELIREELHRILSEGFHVPSIHSEYGMTELLSQAYSKGNGSFNCPPWMDVIIRDTEDALSYIPYGKTGGINVIDLANLHSCSFIATQDLGKKYKDGSFEVLGRFDHSDIRGCNLMVL